MKLDIQTIASGDQLLVSDDTTGEMYGVLEATVSPDCQFNNIELLDAVYRKIGLGEINITGFRKSKKLVQTPEGQEPNE